MHVLSTKNFIELFKLIFNSPANAELTANDMKETADQLNIVIDNFFAAGPPMMDWAFRASPGKWSKKEIVGHLIDSAQVNLQRFVRCTYHENFKLIYAQVEWVQAQHYQEADISELFTLWRLLKLQIVMVLSAYPAERLQVQCDTGRETVSLHTVEWLAKDYLDHLNHHLNQILTP